MEGEKEMKELGPKKGITISRNGIHGGNGHIFTSSATQTYSGPAPSSLVVRYKECHKNHAAAIGGNATDGCGEFMPSGEQGTLEALECSACNCHRNFHRKEIDGGESSFSPVNNRLNLGNHNAIVGPPQGYPVNRLLSSRAMPNQQMIVSCRSGSVPSESDEKDDGDIAMAIRAVEKPQKRFRTKFTEDQKQKMLSFAEKAGWKMQKLDESVVQQFCQEIGIKRRVLKVWMHNNKHHFAKKVSSTI